MRLVINKSHLAQALHQVTRAIPSRTPKPILYGIKLMATEDSVFITAYNLEIGIETQITNTDLDAEPILQIQEPGAIVLTSRYFVDIVRKLPQSLIRIDVKDLTATISSGSATFVLNGMDAREYPLLPDVQDDRGFSLQSDILKSLINHTSYAVATVESRPTLTGVLWTYNDGLLTLTATDSHRLSKESIPSDSQKDYALIDSIIPGKSLNELAKILPDSDSLVDILVANNQALFRFGMVRFYSRLLEGNYPDTSRIIPNTFRTNIIIATKSLLESIERAALLARDTENQVIRMHLRPHQIEVSCQSPEIGKITETLEPKSFEGEEMFLACNAKYLIDALHVILTEEVKIAFTGPGSAFVIKPVDHERHLQLILPVRFVN